MGPRPDKSVSAGLTLGRQPIPAGFKQLIASHRAYGVYRPLSRPSVAAVPLQNLVDRRGVGLDVDPGPLFLEQHRHS